MTLRERAEREPLGVDISDYSDEWCAGFLAGQVNTLDALNLRTCPYCAHTVEWQDSDPIEGPCAGCRRSDGLEELVADCAAVIEAMANGASRQDCSPLLDRIIAYLNEKEGA